MSELPGDQGGKVDPGYPEDLQQKDGEFEGFHDQQMHCPKSET